MVQVSCNFLQTGTNKIQVPVYESDKFNNWEPAIQKPDRDTTVYNFDYSDRLKKDYGILVGKYIGQPAFSYELTFEMTRKCKNYNFEI